MSAFAVRGGLDLGETSDVMIRVARASVRSDQTRGGGPA